LNENRGAYLNIEGDVEGNAQLQFFIEGTNNQWYTLSTAAAQINFRQRKNANYLLKQ
jgi:hypothetical protein